MRRLTPVLSPLVALMSLALRTTLLTAFLAGWRIAGLLRLDDGPQAGLIADGRRGRRFYGRRRRFRRLPRLILRAVRFDYDFRFRGIRNRLAQERR